MEEVLIHPVEPSTWITLLDGRKCGLLLSYAGLGRLLNRYGKNFVPSPGGNIEYSITVLYEALIDKGGLTEEQFGNLLPCDPEEITRAVEALMPKQKAKNDRPMQPSGEETPETAMDSSTSGPSGPSG